MAHNDDLDLDLDFGDDSPAFTQRHFQQGLWQFELLFLYSIC